MNQKREELLRSVASRLANLLNSNQETQVGNLIYSDEMSILKNTSGFNLADLKRTISKNSGSINEYSLRPLVKKVLFNE